jgi:hypothetical protein
MLNGVSAEAVGASSFYGSRSTTMTQLRPRNRGDKVNSNLTAKC